mgnify:CR=1 FL=1
MSLLPYIITLTHTHNDDPIQTIPMNVPSSFFLIAFDSITIDGSERVVTAIIKDKIVPSPAPFASRLSATGMVPKISAYMGTPTAVASARRTRSVFQECFGRYALGSRIVDSCPDDDSDNDIRSYLFDGSHNLIFA